MILTFSPYFYTESGGHSPSGKKNWEVFEVSSRKFATALITFVTYIFERRKGLCTVTKMYRGGSQYLDERDTSDQDVWRKIFTRLLDE